MTWTQWITLWQSRYWENLQLRRTWGISRLRLKFLTLHVPLPQNMEPDHSHHCVSCWPGTVGTMLTLILDMGFPKFLWPLCSWIQFADQMTYQKWLKKLCQFSPLGEWNDGKVVWIWLSFQNQTLGNMVTFPITHHLPWYWPNSLEIFKP